MSILERLQSDVKDAMRARDSERSTALRMLVAALQNEAKARQQELTEEQEIAVLTRERKKRVEAAEAFEGAGAGAEERAATERAQQQMIEAYLPEQLDEAEIERLVAEAIAETGASSPKEMGLVMKALMPKVQGRADGKLVSGAVQRALAS